MKTVKIALAALVITALSFEGCKKGEGDPFLSLKSRKARVAGEWKVTKGEGKDISGSATTTWTYDGTTQTNTTGAFTSTDKFTDEYTFEKDGTFKLTETDNNGSPAVVTTVTGTWNFTGGVGDMKNKSQLLLTYLVITSGTVTTTYSGSDAPSSYMDIYQLKSKEMIFKGTGTTTTAAGQTTSDFQWTLEPK